jgi:hypothetical protein
VPNAQRENNTSKKNKWCYAHEGSFEGVFFGGVEAQQMGVCPWLHEIESSRFGLPGKFGRSQAGPAWPAWSGAGIVSRKDSDRNGGTLNRNTSFGSVMSL